MRRGWLDAFFAAAAPIGYIPPTLTADAIDVGAGAFAGAGAAGRGLAGVAPFENIPLTLVAAAIGDCGRGRFFRGAAPFANIPETLVAASIGDIGRGAAFGLGGNIPPTLTASTIDVGDDGFAGAGAAAVLGAAAAGAEAAGLAAGDFAVAAGGGVGAAAGSGSPGLQPNGFPVSRLILGPGPVCWSGAGIPGMAAPLGLMSFDGSTFGASFHLRFIALASAAAFRLAVVVSTPAW